MTNKSAADVINHSFAFIYFLKMIFTITGGTSGAGSGGVDITTQRLIGLFFF